MQTITGGFWQYLLGSTESTGEKHLSQNIFLNCNHHLDLLLTIKNSCFEILTLGHWCSACLLHHSLLRSLPLPLMLFCSLLLHMCLLCFILFFYKCAAGFEGIHTKKALPETSLSWRQPHLSVLAGWVVKDSFTCSWLYGGLLVMAHSGCSPWALSCIQWKIWEWQSRWCGVNLRGEVSYGTVLSSSLVHI